MFNQVFSKMLFNKKHTMHAINYKQFRQILNNSNIGQVKHKPAATTILNAKGEIIATMQAAKMDKFGRTEPVKYFAVEKEQFFKAPTTFKTLAA